MTSSTHLSNGGVSSLQGHHVYICAITLVQSSSSINHVNGPMPWLDRLGLSTYQVLCLGATIVEQDLYLTYLDDQWTPTADGQNMT